jgi:hypothetical protein
LDSPALELDDEHAAIGGLRQLVLDRRTVPAILVGRVGKLDAVLDAGRLGLLDRGLGDLRRFHRCTSVV